MSIETIRQVPFVRLAIPFISGILLGSLFPGMQVVFSGIFLFLLLLAVIVLSGLRRMASPQLVRRFGMLIYVLLVLAGYCIKKDYQPQEYRDAFVSGTVLEEAVEKNKSWKILLGELLLEKGEENQPLPGKAVCYLQKSGDCGNLLPGGRLLLRSGLRLIDPPGNPGEFDYRRYLHGRGIYWQNYVREGDWELQKDQKRNHILISSGQIRKQLVDRLGNFISGEKERAVLLSILLGYREDLDPEQRLVFVRAGTMHILAVSGLHVGIIYLLLSILLKGAGAVPGGRFLSSFIVLAALWGYALVTGLPSSVVRAVTMFSVLSVSRLRGKPVVFLNSIAFTALLMLAIRPAALMEAGFQLSFAAVTGIAVFYRGISSVWLPRRFLLKKVWQMIALSVSAQLGTAPLAIFHFSCFPNYFLLSNILVLPLVSLILYGGLFFFAFSWNEFLAGTSGFLLEKVTGLLIRISEGIAGLPLAVFEQLCLSRIQVGLLYLIILSLFLFLSGRKHWWLRFLIICLAVWMLRDCLDIIRGYKRTSLVVFSLSEGSALGIVRGREGFLYDDRPAGDRTPDIPEQFFRGCRLRRFSKLCVQNPGGGLVIHSAVPSAGGLSCIGLIPDPDSGMVCSGYTGIEVGGKRILIIRDMESAGISGPEAIAIDYLVITSNAVKNLNDLLEVFSPALVILDRSNSKYLIDRWKRELEADGVNYCTTEHFACMEQIMTKSK